MRIHSGWVAGFASVIGFLLVSSGAQAGFCSTYQQTWSNAGQCPTCQLNIKHWPGEQAYTVFANNGWQAELNYVEGDSSVATGGGTWQRGLRHAYSGENFDMDLSQQGQQLSMIMSTMVNGQQQVIRAEFRCMG